MLRMRHELHLAHAREDLDGRLRREVRLLHVQPADAISAATTVAEQPTSSVAQLAAIAAASCATGHATWLASIALASCASGTTSKHSTLSPRQMPDLAFKLRN